MNKKYKQLIAQGKEIMRTSTDPIHDFDHVSRVVQMTKQMGREARLSKKHMQAAILAAWWHDASRTLFKKPSMILVLVDDLLSAAMLFKHVVKKGAFNKTTSTAIRVILCKSVTAGFFLTYFFLNKTERLICDIVEDADTMDIMHAARVKKFLPLLDQYKRYKLGYRILAWFNFSTGALKMKTKIAQKHLHNNIKGYFDLVHIKEIQEIHFKHFGKKWSLKMKQKIESQLEHLKKINIPGVQKEIKKM